MKSNSKIRLIFLLCCAFGISSCKRNQCEDTLPSIEYGSFAKFDNTKALLTIKFKDCDGDIGLSESDTISPFNIDGDYYNNLLLNYWELRNGKWELWSDLTPPFHYRIKNITPEGPKKQLDGEINVTLEPFYYVPTSVYDTFKFEIILVDRNLNKSNSVMTPELIKP